MFVLFLLYLYEILRLVKWRMVVSTGNGELFNWESFSLGRGTTFWRQSDGCPTMGCTKTHWITELKMGKVGNLCVYWDTYTKCTKAL